MKFADNDRLKAIRLYEENSRLSALLYAPIQGLEICLRNMLNYRLIEHWGSGWYDQLGFLSGPPREKIIQAKSNLLKRQLLLTDGRVVSELSFGFWTAILASNYEKQMWVPALHRAFPHATASDGRPLKRSKVHGRLDRVRDLRNRIAHHERIIRRPLKQEYLDIIEAVSWMCPTTAAWIKSTTASPNQTTTT